MRAAEVLQTDSLVSRDQLRDGKALLEIMVPSRRMLTAFDIHPPI
jgi:hypothetical protein